MLDLLSNESMLLTTNSDLNEGTRLKIATIGRLKRLLQREKQGFLKVLHRRCGVGLSTSEFNAVVLGLSDQNWCYLREGRQGGVTVVFNEHFNNVNVPDVPE